MPYKLQKLVAAKRFSSPVTKQVLSAVVRYMNENGTGAFPSVKTIASDISRGRSTVFKHMAMLKADGLLIEVGKRPCHGGATKVYNLGYKALQTLPDEKGKGPSGRWMGGVLHADVLSSGTWTQTSLETAHEGEGRARPRR